MSVSKLRKDLKLAVGTKILDIAEMLPSFNGGFIQYLQEMRQNARAQIDQDFLNTRLPEGACWEIPRILMFQVYPIEDIDILMNDCDGEDLRQRQIHEKFRLAQGC
jgi:hypothetical protein